MPSPHPLLRCLFFAAIPVAVAAAQPPAPQVEIEARIFTMSPPARTEFLMGAFGGGVTAVHGGFDLSKSHEDTWTANGSTWVDGTPMNGPGAIEYGAMAVDLAHGMGVSFGGQDAQQVFRNDTDLLTLSLAADALAWTKASPMNSPSARRDHAMAYDPLRRKVVLFGGTDDPTLTTELNDTWEWDGMNWTRITTPHSPPRLYDHKMVYMHSMQAIVLFGGADQTQFYNQTWKYDGTDWTQLSPTTSPSGRVAHDMAYHVARDRIILFGGFDIGGNCLGDTWEFDGSTWIQAMPTTNPAPRGGHAMVYDENRQRVVMFGGCNIPLATFFDETWEFFSTSPATYELFGTGCPGSVGVPSLDAAPGSGPWVNDDFTLQLGNLPSNGLPAFVAFGFSNTDWSGIPLPADLTPTGIWGCTGYVAVDVAVPVPTSGGAGQYTLSIPPDPSLVGVDFFNQALVQDVGVNPAAAIVTNAGHGQIGVK